MTPGAPLDRTLLTPRVLVATRGGESLRESFGANATALLGERGVLLVDPLIAPSEARLVEESVRERTGAPLAGVVLTHHHTDHALGAGLFARRGVPVYASRRCAELMARWHPGIVAARRSDPALADLFADADPYAPTSIVEEETALDLGGLTALIRVVGPAHTAGDLVVEAPGEGVLVAGDLVSNGYHVNYEEADVIGYGRALRALAARPFAHVVPGRGAPGGAELLTMALAAHERARELVRAAHEAGLDEAAAVSRLAAAFPEHRLAAVLPDTVRAFAG